MGVEPPRPRVLDLLRGHELDREVRALGAAQLELPGEVMLVVHLELDVGRHHHAVVAADRAVHLRLVHPDPGVHRAVVEARREPRLHLHVAALALHDPQQLVVRVGPAAPAHREAVDDPRGATARPEARDEHERPLQVVA